MHIGAKHIKIKGTAPVFFISDLHLSKQMPATSAVFFRFLQHIAPQAQALFILGDLFEYWVGDDCLYAHNATISDLPRTVAAHLTALHRQGVAIYFLPGNRDFLLSTGFSKAASTTLLDDVCLLEIDTKEETTSPRIVLAHGDTLCIADQAYQRYRHWVHKIWLQRLFLACPLTWRWQLGKKIHAQSQAQQRLHASKPYADVDTTAAENLLRAYRAPLLIHGHTHQPQCHTLDNGLRWVLSDWDFDHARRGSYLSLDPKEIKAGTILMPKELSVPYEN